MATNDDATPSRRRLLKIAATAAAAAPMGARAWDKGGVNPLGTAGAGTAGPDAELLRLCAEWKENRATAEALMEPYYDAVGGWPPDVAARLTALTDEGHRLDACIAALPAAGTAGVAAKARLALWKMDCAAGGLGVPDDDDRLAWSALRDMLALAGAAA